MAAEEVSIARDGIASVRTSVERVLSQAGHGMPAHPFNTAADFPEFWREATALHGGDDLALRVASELPVGAFGRTSYAFASAATIGDALHVFRRDAQRAITGATATLQNTPAGAELSLHGPALLWPIFELLLAVIALRCQQLPEDPVPILRVVLPRAAPRNVTPWQRLFTVVPRFDADHGALVVAAAMLARPLRTSDAAVREALGTGPTTSITEEVTTHVRAWVRESPAIEDVARALGMSMRTLQRRLGEEGVTFRQLVLDTKMDVAKQLLEQRNLSVKRVAAAVGFASVAAFSTAFSTHTGTSPTAFLKKPR